MLGLTVKKLVWKEGVAHKLKLHWNFRFNFLLRLYSHLLNFFLSLLNLSFLAFSQSFRCRMNRSFFPRLSLSHNPHCSLKNRWTKVCPFFVIRNWYIRTCLSVVIFVVYLWPLRSSFGFFFKITRAPSNFLLLVKFLFKFVHFLLK